jgi:ribonuclease D
MLADLASRSHVAVDTESNSLHAFREQVCLIQFSTAQRDYLVDPLILSDLKPLGPLFANPHIQKIFHAAEYDVLCLSRDFGFKFANLFDTMQAARILGCEKVGLDAILSSRFDIHLNKRYQKADWGARPLTSEQIDYARFDTHYLIPLRNQLKKELEQAGRWTLAREDFQRLCWTNGDHAEPPEAWERFASRRDLNPRQLTVLRELCSAREEIAPRLDRPPFKVLGDDKLIAAARSIPSTKEGLEEIGLTSRQVNRWGAEVLSAVARGIQSPLVKRRQAQRPDEAVLNRLERLKKWRKKVAAQMGVESDVVLPRVYLMSLSERGGREVKSILESSPWRLEQFGAQIKEVLGD